MLTALLFQRKIALDDDDIKNEESEFLVGGIPFKYLTLKINKTKEGKISSEQATYTMRTQAKVEFKPGDVVKVLNVEYSIVDVVLTIDPKHERFLAMNPNAAERLTIKELILK